MSDIDSCFDAINKCLNSNILNRNEEHCNKCLKK